MITIPFWFHCICVIVLSLVVAFLVWLFFYWLYLKYQDYKENKERINTYMLKVNQIDKSFYHLVENICDSWYYDSIDGYSNFKLKKQEVKKVKKK